MLKKISKFLNIRVLLLIAAVLVFVFLSSSQETYVSIENVPISTLITTDFGNTNTTEPSTTTSPPPTPPTETPSSPPNGGITQGNKPTLDSQYLPIIVSATILILIGFFFLRRRKEAQQASPITRARGVSTLAAKRDKFRTQIKSLVELLYEYLESGKYTEGVIFGFHELDKNMKRILGIQREGYLTPKEFSSSLEIPEMIELLNEMVHTFYIARYRISPMKYEDLENFIKHLQGLQELSRTKSEIQVTQRDIIGDETE